MLAGALERAVGRERITREDADAQAARVTYTTRFEDLAEAEAVIEAITEDARAKGELFKLLDAELPGARFLASNTSAIPIAELAAWTERPDRVLGLHFFSPVPVMKLVEVVVALETSDETVSTAEEFARAIGKRAIRTKDRSGFIVNMLLVPYLMAAVRMYEEGFASREDIDDGMRLGAGHPMGPLRLADMVGLDVVHAVCVSLYDEFGRPDFAPPPLLKRMIAAGRLGQKSGRGFYEYGPAAIRP
jgi:3-hydroxybutyryl-CoA dehydrogenase